MSLVKVGLELGIDIAPNFTDGKLEPLRSLDLQKVMDLVERGLIGKIVEVESAEGDTVEVVVE